MLVRGRSAITDAMLKTHMPPKNLLVITSTYQYALCLELVTFLAKQALTQCACSMLLMISKKCTRLYLQLAIPIKPFNPFGLCLLRLTARGWGTCQLKASQLQLSQKHSQLTIDTDIYYTHRLCLRHLT